MPRRPTDLDNSRARATVLAVCAGSRLFDRFCCSQSFVFSLSLSLGDSWI